MGSAHQGENWARSDTEPRRRWSVGLQPDGGAHLRQLAHPRPAQLEDPQRLQDPPWLHPPDILLAGGTALRQDTGPAASGRTLRPARRPSELRQGLGLEVQPAECRLLSLLA